MKCLILLFILSLFSCNLFAQENLQIGEANFSIKKNQTLNSIDSAVEDMEGFLDNFKPVGAQISTPKIIGNNIEFIVTKKVAFITKKARINADVSVNKKVTFCPRTATTGFEIYFDLEKSDNLVTSNIEAIIMDFCITENGKNQAQISAKGYLTKAPTFDGILVGKMIASEIGNQIPSLIEAFKIHVANQK